MGAVAGRSLLLSALLVLSLRDCALCWAGFSFPSLMRRKRIVKIVVPSDDVKEKDNATHSFFMKMALEEATSAGKKGEVPIGALIVRPVVNGADFDAMNNNKNSLDTSADLSMFHVLASASNRVETHRDATAHAELLAMRQAAKNNGAANWRLLNTTLYTTVEPCAMCLAAAQAFRVEKIVYGAPDIRIGAIDSYLNLLQMEHPIHTIHHVVRGVGRKESANLLRSFFRQQRKARRQQKRKKSHGDQPAYHLFRRIVNFWKRK